MRTMVFGLVLATSTVAPSFALAQVPAKVDPAKASMAKRYVDAGLAAQNGKDYDTAISLYQKAHDLVPHPVLLFNIGQAHRLAGRDTEAQAFYTRYLEADPSGPQAKDARDFIREIDAKRVEAARIAAAEQQAAEAARADAARKAEEARQAEAAARAQEAKQAELAEAERARERETAEAAARAQRDAEEARARRGRPLRIAGIASAGTGAVAIGVSVVLGLKARSLSNELSESGAMFDPTKVDDGESAERLSIITGVAGGALLVGGAVLYYMGHRARGESSVQVSASAEHVGLYYTGTLP